MNRTKATKTAVQLSNAAQKAEPSQTAVEVTVAILLTPEQLALKLSVSPSWIREKTRERARQRDADPLPVVRLGKYVRFRWTDIDAWLKRQSC